MQRTAVLHDRVAPGDLDRPVVHDATLGLPCDVLVEEFEQLSVASHPPTCKVEPRTAFDHDAFERREPRVDSRSVTHSEERQLTHCVSRVNLARAVRTEGSEPCDALAMRLAEL